MLMNKIKLIALMSTALYSSLAFAEGMSNPLINPEAIKKAQNYQLPPPPAQPEKLPPPIVIQPLLFHDFRINAIVGDKIILSIDNKSANPQQAPINNNNGQNYGQLLKQTDQEPKKIITVTNNIIVNNGEAFTIEDREYVARIENSGAVKISFLKEKNKSVTVYPSYSDKSSYFAKRKVETDSSYISRFPSSKGISGGTTSTTPAPSTSGSPQPASGGAN